jgi:hypothetical protein
MRPMPLLLLPLMLLQLLLQGVLLLCWPQAGSCSSTWCLQFLPSCRCCCRAQ